MVQLVKVLDSDRLVQIFICWFTVELALQQALCHLEIELYMLSLLDEQLVLFVLDVLVHELIDALDGLLLSIRVSVSHRGLELLHCLGLEPMTMQEGFHVDFVVGLSLLIHMAQPVEVLFLHRQKGVSLIDVVLELPVRKPSTMVMDDLAVVLRDQAQRKC